MVIAPVILGFDFMKKHKIMLDFTLRGEVHSKAIPTCEYRSFASVTTEYQVPY